MVLPGRYRRSARPDAAEQTVLWLGSDDASFVTGDVLMADGGFTAR
jgi:NAD(P)-dependent dehydrogenase (short-subunit alcohol dehydrogenase family)